MGFGVELLGVIRIVLTKISCAEEKKSKARFEFGGFVEIGGERPRGCQTPQATGAECVSVEFECLLRGAGRGIAIHSFQQQRVRALETNECWRAVTHPQR